VPCNFYLRAEMAAYAAKSSNPLGEENVSGGPIPRAALPALILRGAFSPQCLTATCVIMGGIAEDFNNTLKG